jgi:hypothetical protein
VLQALDTDAYNACHVAVAALARAGIVRALVTTNFDRLLERALDGAGVPLRVYASPDEFDELASRIETGGASAPLPIIKPHGSIDHPEHMVDTLRQRIAGRPATLERALVALLHRHPWLLVGFSGADLSYDYLGLRPAAVGARGIIVLQRFGGRPAPGDEQSGHGLW